VRAPTAILSACAALAAAGCSDEEEPVRTETVRPGATVQMEADEYRFDPGRLVMRAGARRAPLRIVLANRGTLAHNLHVRDGERELGSTPSFRAGETRSVALSLAPGNYTFLCTVADHEELGMIGRLEIR
jgi:plastocyanin